MGDRASARLPGTEYKAVFGRGRAVKGRLVSAWRLDGCGAGAKAGVVVSRKTFSLAVRRNRAKRLMREAFRLLGKEGVAPGGVEWVFSARRQIAGKTCRDVMEEMRRMMSAASPRGS